MPGRGTEPDPQQSTLGRHHLPSLAPVRCALLRPPALPAPDRPPTLDDVPTGSPQLSCQRTLRAHRAPAIDGSGCASAGTYIARSSPRRIHPFRVHVWLNSHQP
jgi:hypothetical protein